MELHQLRCFVTLAETLHFRRAAETLGIAQPNLTRIIQQLEASVGAGLFERNQRNVALTEAGQALLPEAQKLLSQAEVALESTRRSAKGEMGNLHIGFVLSTAYSVFPDYVRKFRAHCPEVQLSFSEASTAEQEKALLEGRLSAGFVYPPLYSSELEHRVLGHEQIVAALPKGHPRAKQKTVTISDLADTPWIFFPRWDAPYMYDLTMTRCREAGFQPKIVHEVQLAQVGLALVAAGVGVYFTFASLQAMRLPGVVFRPLEGVPQLDVALAWHKTKTSAALRRLLERL